MRVAPLFTLVAFLFVFLMSGVLLLCSFSLRCPVSACSTCLWYFLIILTSFVVHLFWGTALLIDYH